MFHSQFAQQMTKVFTVVLLAVLVLLPLWSISAADIITGFPSDPVVCYGGVSTLYCGSNRSDITILSWSVLVDGITLTTSELEAIGIHTESNIITEDNATAVITIPGSDDTYGVEIACTAVTGSFDFQRKSTAFTVTDIPAVTDIDVQFNDSVMIATWTAPSCLPVNYCYHVTVSNDTMTIIATNTTSTQYQMLAVSSCVNYTISVTVMDTGPGGYESVTANVTESISLADALTTIKPHNLTVEFIYANSSQVIIPLEFICSVSICSAVLLQFTQELELPSGLNFIEENITIGPSNDTTDVVDYIVGPFEEKFKANLTILLMNKTELFIEISTFNVQKFRIEDCKNYSTVITCLFADNSYADGCRVHFVQSDTVTIEHFIPKHVNEDIASTDVIIPNGDYTVLVYDVINGQPISISPAYTTRYTAVTHVNTTSLATKTAVSSSNVLTSSSFITPSVSETVESSTVTVVAVAVVVVVVVAIVLLVFVVVLFMRRHRGSACVSPITDHGENGPDPNNSSGKKTNPFSFCRGKTKSTPCICTGVTDLYSTESQNSSEGQNSMNYSFEAQLQTSRDNTRSIVVSTFENCFHQGSNDSFGEKSLLLPDRGYAVASEPTSYVHVPFLHHAEFQEKKDPTESANTEMYSTPVADITNEYSQEAFPASNSACHAQLVVHTRFGQQDTAAIDSALQQQYVTSPRNEVKVLSESSNHCEFEKFHIHDVIPCEGPEMIQPTHHLVHVKKKMFVEGATLKLATTSEVLLFSKSNGVFASATTDVSTVSSSCEVDRNCGVNCRQNQDNLLSKRLLSDEHIIEKQNRQSSCRTSVLHQLNRSWRFKQSLTLHQQPVNDYDASTTLPVILLWLLLIRYLLGALPLHEQLEGHHWLV